MFVVDTNLLVYAANDEVPEHGRARELIEGWRAGQEQWFLTWSIAYEFLQVTTSRRLHRQILPLADAVRFVESVLASPVVSLLMETPRHRAVMRDLALQHPRLSGPKVHDLHIAALMKEHGIGEIRTADADFHQFQFLKVVNPLAA